MLIRIELIALVISLSALIAAGVLMLLLERMFVNYIKKYNNDLWQKYKNFEPKWWWRFSDFIRQTEKSGDTNIDKLRLRVFQCEKLAFVAILAVIVTFVSTIITSIITSQ